MRSILTYIANGNYHSITLNSIRRKKELFWLLNQQEYIKEQNLFDKQTNWIEKNNQVLIYG